MVALDSITLLCLILSNLRTVWTGRTWKSNLDFNNPNNWSPGRVPCPADRMVFRALDSLVLQLPEGQTAIGGIVMAESAKLVLPKNGGLQLTGVKNSASCNGQDAVFKHTRAMRWIDVDNWDGWNPATPDLERVPCAWEEVRFTPGTTFNIITPPKLKLGSLEINGVVMDSLDWYEYSNNEDTVLQLHKLDGDPPEISYSPASCQGATWCVCENEYLHADVCKATCPQPLCKQPVMPAGFCCPLCGAFFLMRNKEQERRRLADIINPLLKDKGVVWHASKVGEFIQIVLVEEREYSGGIAEIAEELKAAIEKNGADWRLEHLYTSGHVWYPISFTQVVGHFLSLLVFAVITLAAIVAFYSKESSWTQFSPSRGRPFVFARFENQSGELLVAHEQRQPSLSSPSQAFDNPMYGTSGQVQRNITVENPVYTELDPTSESCDIEEAITLNSQEL